MDFEWKKPKHQIKENQLPTKRTINLVAVGQKTIHIRFAVPGILVILILATAFSKFAVVDRLKKVSVAQQEANDAKRLVEAGYKKIEQYGDITEEYAHYTYSDFHEEEVNSADRMEVIKMLEKYVYPKASIGAWYLFKNELTLPITSTSLKEINDIVSTLETTDLVDFCTVNTATTGDYKSSGRSMVNGNERNTSIVTAQVTVYLKGAMTDNNKEGEEEDESIQP